MIPFYSDKEDKDFRDVAGAAASAFNTLRLEPDKGLDTALQTIKQQRTARRAKNKTVEYLRGLGQPEATRLANMVETGELTGQQAYSQIFALEQEKRAADRAAANASRSYDNQVKLAELRHRLGMERDAAVKSTTQTAFETEFGIYKRAYPDLNDAQILEMINKETSSAPAQFEALRLQALAAGLEEGSPEYQNFMLTRGAGEVAAAKLDAKAVVQAPATVQKAQGAIDAIDAILGNESLAGVTGKYEGQFGTTGFGSAYFSQDEIDLIKDIENLEAKVFLEAFETLKGGGQITEREGIQAQRAMENLSRQQSPQKLQDNLRDLKEVIMLGQERARNKIKVPENERYNGPLGAGYKFGQDQGTGSDVTKKDASGRTYRLIDKGNGVMQKVYD